MPKPYVTTKRIDLPKVRLLYIAIRTHQFKRDESKMGELMTGGSGSYNGGVLSDRSDSTYLTSYQRMARGMG